MTIFPKILLFSPSKQKYSFLVRFCTGCVFVFGLECRILWKVFCLEKLTGLTESTGMFIFTSIPSPVVFSEAFLFPALFSHQQFFISSTEKITSSLLTFLFLA